MKPFIKYGLLVGVISLIIIIPIAALLGICGPFITMTAGALAGFLSAYVGKSTTRREGAQSGAMAGAIAGGFTLIGQIIQIRQRFRINPAKTLRLWSPPGDQSPGDQAAPVEAGL